MGSPFRTKTGKLVNEPIRKVSPKGVVSTAPTKMPKNLLKKKADRAKKVLWKKFEKQIRQNHPDWTATQVFFKTRSAVTKFWNGR